MLRRMCVSVLKPSRNRVAIVPLLHANTGTIAVQYRHYCTLVRPVLHRSMASDVAQNRHFVQKSGRSDAPFCPKTSSENYSETLRFSILSVSVEPFPMPDCSIFRSLLHISPQAISWVLSGAKGLHKRRRHPAGDMFGTNLWGQVVNGMRFFCNFAKKEHTSTSSYRHDTINDRLRQGSRNP